MRKIRILLAVLLLLGVAFSPVMAANFYWKTTLADLTAILGASDGDRGLVIGPAGDVTFYLRTGGLWILATTSVSWNLVTDRPTINGVTITGAVLDNASNYPTLNQNTTGNAATATTLSGQDQGAAPPTTGTWPRGWVRWNTAAELGGASYWHCVTAGTPGVWGAVLINGEPSL